MTIITAANSGRGNYASESALWPTAVRAIRVHRHRLALRPRGKLHMLLHRVAEALLDRETLTGEDVKALERGEKLPPRAAPPSSPPALPAKETSVPSGKPVKPPLFGGPEPAPA